MSPRARRTTRRSLVDELLRNHRIMLQVLALLLAVALVTVCSRLAIWALRAWKDMSM